MQFAPSRWLAWSYCIALLLTLPLGAGSGCSGAGGGEARAVGSPRHKGPAAAPEAPEVMEVTDTPPERPGEFRAAFVTVAYNFDWPLPQTTDHKEQIKRVAERAKALNFNVIILQVRAFGDRIHKNHQHREPFSQFVNGGVEPPDYDPLCEWIKQCHVNGIELHAWVNPFRTTRNPELPEEQFWHDKHFWHDPTKPAVHKRLVMEIIKELTDHCPGALVDVEVKGAKHKLDEEGGIDGILIDHYVPDPPPPGVKGKGRPDDVPRAYGAKRNAVRQFIRMLYNEISTGNPTEPRKHIKLGLSPEMNPYANPMVDMGKWLEDGNFHYMIPELYDRSQEEFATAFDWYLTNNPRKPNQLRPIMVAGLMTARTQVPESPVFPTWGREVVVDQVKRSRQMLDAKRQQGGQAHYSFNALRAEHVLNNAGDALLDPALEAVYAEPALVPAVVTPTHAPQQLDAPQKIEVADPSGGERDVKWERTGSKVWLWEFWFRNGGAWTMKIVPGMADPSTTSYKTRVPARADRVFIRGIDRFNRPGKPAAVPIRAE